MALSFTPINNLPITPAFQDRDLVNVFETPVTELVTLLEFHISAERPLAAPDDSYGAENLGHEGST